MKQSVPRYFVSEGNFFFTINILSFLVIALFRLPIGFLCIPLEFLGLLCLLVYFSVLNLSTMFLSIYLSIVILVVTLGVSNIPKLSQFIILFQYFMTSREIEKSNHSLHTTFSPTFIIILNITCTFIGKHQTMLEVLLSITKLNFKKLKRKRIAYYIQSHYFPSLLLIYTVTISFHV